uniref:Uncharacterized protein n=1 Tax=Anguilla anguilla TaxID=7936 RepID=A0A0E9QGV1_ANGAN
MIDCFSLIFTKTGNMLTFFIIYATARGLLSGQMRRAVCYRAFFSQCTGWARDYHGGPSTYPGHL